MKILIACEQSGRVRDAFRDKGHEAWSNDLEGVEVEGKYTRFHLACDALEAINTTNNGFNWDMIIAFPPCTYLAVSGLHWNKRIPGRAEKTELALDFVRAIMDADCPRIAVENPVGCISTRIRKPDQYIQPHQFGEDASKKTCLWLKGLPRLRPTKRIPGRMVNGKERWANQTDSGQNKLGPSPDRAKIRSITYPGIAEAMSTQWNF